MDVNLVVINGRFDIKSGTLDLRSFCQKCKTQPGVRRRGGRVDFYALGNLVSVTACGFIAIYISVDKTFVLEQIGQILLVIRETLLPFTTRKESFSVIKCKAVNLHMSGKFVLERITLLRRLKKCMLGEAGEFGGNNSRFGTNYYMRFTQPSAFPDPPPFAHTNKLNEREDYDISYMEFHNHHLQADLIRVLGECCERNYTRWKSFRKLCLSYL